MKTGENLLDFSATGKCIGNDIQASFVQYTGF